MTEQELGKLKLFTSTEENIHNNLIENNLSLSRIKRAISYTY